MTMVSIKFYDLYFKQSNVQNVSKKINITLAVEYNELVKNTVGKYCMRRY